MLDTTKTIDLSDDELALGKKLVADAKQAQELEAALIKGKYIEGQAVELLNKGNGSVTLEAARLAIESRLGGELMPDDWLYFDATGEVQVRVVLANLAQYNLQTMSDPLEPDSGQCKAILYANIGHGEPIIHSFSHGGQNYKFAKRKMWTCDDAREAVYALAAERALETAAEGSPEDIAFIKRIKSLYTDIFQSNDFDEADQDEMRALCKKKFKCNKETLDDIAKAARGKGGASGGGSGKPVESITAAKLLPGVEYDWLYEGKTGRYFQYNGAGLWEVSGNVAFLGLVKKRMETHDDIIEYGFKEAFLNGVEGLLSIDLCGDLTAQPHNLIPFRNGVLDIKTGKKIEHAAENHLTWQLGFDYQRSATCLFFQTWLLQRLGSEERVILIRAIIGAILMGLADLQFFVELQGTAGAGKSVFQWLLSQLVGEKNIGTTDLERLEKERFEAAGLVGKRMILISDSKSWAGEVPKLKAITGNDLIPIERKHQQQNGEGAMIDGIVVVATNKPIQVTDLSNAIPRRRVTVPWTKPVPADEMRDNIQDDLGKELGGIVVWALDFGELNIRQTITKNKGDRRSEDSINVLINTNMMAAWLDDKVLYKPGHKTNIGNASSPERHHEWLYPNYEKFLMDDSRSSKPLGVRNFGTTLNVLLSETLKLRHCHILSKNRDGRQFEGLALRGCGDDTMHSPLAVARTMAGM